MIYSGSLLPRLLLSWEYIAFLGTRVLPASQSTSLPPFPLSCLYYRTLTWPPYPACHSHLSIASLARLSVSALICSHSHLTCPGLFVSHCLYLLLFLPSFHCLSHDTCDWGCLPASSMLAQLPAFPLPNFPEYSQCYLPGKTSFLSLFTPHSSSQEKMKVRNHK